jgi:hypothetical protein
MLGLLAVRTRTWPVQLLRRLVAPQWHPRDLDWEWPKLRLLACAWCRRVAADLTDERSRRAIEVSERYADGRAPPEELTLAASEARTVTGGGVGDGTGRSELTAVGAADAAASLVRRDGYWPGVMIAVYQAAWAETWAAHPPPAPASLPEAVAVRPVFADHAGLIRDIFGNPFRPAPAVDPAWLAWRGGTVRELAWAAYEERRLPEGTLDPARLAVLADAMEDAGCTDAEILGHLRRPGQHVRGCWALDLVPRQIVTPGVAMRRRKQVALVVRLVMLFGARSWRGSDRCHRRGLAIADWC